MYSKIENGILSIFDDRDLVDGTFIVPDYVNEIDDKAFSNELYIDENGRVKERQASKIKRVVIPKTVKRVGLFAFKNCTELETVEIANGVEILDDDCFSTCEHLTQINVPESVKKIGLNAFSNCENLKSVKVFDKEYAIDDLPYLFDFLIYTKQNHKFLPNTAIMKNTPQADIPSFYTHSKVWRKVLSDYTMKWADFIVQNTMDGKLADEITCDLYSYCLALGVFEGGKQQKEAVDFIEKNLFEFNPFDLHQSLGGLGSMHFGAMGGHAFIPEFAKFYMTNYHPPVEQNGIQVPFLCKRVGDSIEQFAPFVYDEWLNAIKKAYPNKTVLAHREHASENNSLTEQDVLDVADSQVYENVEEGNEKLASTIADYGYTQMQFEKMQELWNVAKEIKKSDIILTASPDDDESRIKFELLAKDNPEGFIIGNKTNCCQKIGDAGESCVAYGITKPNSGFAIFECDGRLLGQSWVWYNEKTQTVCLDNIEVPTIWKKKLEADYDLQNEFLKCIARFAKSTRNSMTYNGHPVAQVTIGAGYNDLPAVNSLKRIAVDEDILPDDYYGYSDADEIQYIVNERIAEKSTTNPEITL